MGNVSALAENPIPAETGLGFSTRANGLKNPQKVHVIEMKFQPGLKKESEHAHRLCFRISVIFPCMQIFRVRHITFTAKIHCIYRYMTKYTIFKDILIKKKSPCTKCCLAFSGLKPVT